MHSWNLCWPSVVRIFAISPLLELTLFGLVYSCYALEFLTRFYFVSTWSLDYRVVFDALFLICGYFQSSFMYDLMPILKPMFWDRRCLLFLVSYPFDFHYVIVLLHRTICCCFGNLLMINRYRNKSYELDVVYFFLEARSLEVFGSGSLLADGLWWLDWWVTGQS